jgi:hypothetical protein
VAVAIVDLVDCIPAGPEHAGGACCIPGPRDFAWVLANARRIDLLPVSGRLGLFHFSLPAPTNCMAENGKSITHLA